MRFLRSRAKFTLFTLLIVATLVFTASEIVLRVAFGLGSPALLNEHSKIEYFFAPDQNIRRFGNSIIYNNHAMRSHENLADKHRPRVLVFGDSVVNGGAPTDQKAIATEILQTRLHAYKPNAFVGNVSAGSWGPANVRAWIEEFGDFDADFVLFVFSSHDWKDVPTFEPLDNKTHPTESPILAIQEALFRYLLPRVFRDRKGETEHNARKPSTNASLDVSWLADWAANKRRKPCVILHRTVTEIEQAIDPLSWEISALFAKKEIPLVVAEYSDISNAKAAFRDNIHLNEQGQILLEKAMMTCLLKIGADKF